MNKETLENQILQAIENYGLENAEKQYFDNQDPTTREGREARRLFALLNLDKSGKWFFSKK